MGHFCSHLLVLLNSSACLCCQAISRKQRTFYKAALFFLFLFICQLSYAQQMPGVSTSNYAGIHGLLVNPSQAADTRYSYYLHLGGGQFTTNGSFFKEFNPAGITYHLDLPYKSGLYEASRSSGALNPRQGLHGYAEVLGPSLMIKLSAYNGIALFTRYRSMMNGAGLPAAFAGFYGGRQPQIQQSNGIADGLQLGTTTFSEAGISFGQTLIQRGRHFVKVGGATNNLRVLLRISWS